MGIIPPIGAAGVFTLKAPYHPALIANAYYKCISVRGMGEVIAAGINPKEQYYDKPYGISDDVYLGDLAAGVCIVTLQSSSNGDLVSVPSSYIETYPIVGGVNYTVMGLGVNLGALPDSLDLSFLKDQLAQVVHGVLGVVPDIKTLAISQTKQITAEAHVNAEATRKANVTESDTYRAKYLTASAALTASATKIKELEEFIMTKFPNG